MPHKTSHARRLAVALATSLLAALLAPAAHAAPPGPDRPSLSGIWTGSYAYPPDDPRPPVEFKLLILHNPRSGKLHGFCREPFTFGVGAARHSHARIRGRVDAATGDVSFTKQYDGANGNAHSVEYAGHAADQAMHGSWTYQGLRGSFQLTRTTAAAYELPVRAKSADANDEDAEAADANAADGGPAVNNLTAAWQGVFRLPKDQPGEPVPFELLLLHDGATHQCFGELREPNTFAPGGAPFLYAGVFGTFDPETRALVLVKEYDGTAGVDHAVSYVGRVGPRGGGVTGQWLLDGGLSAPFKLTRAPGVGNVDQLDAPAEKPPASPGNRLDK